METFDFIVIGGGIVGSSVAWQLLRAEPGARVLLVEKETSPAQHQTGRNSGVIHAGIYYAPGSLKSTLCRAGNAATYAFCDEHGIPYERCGKLLVATSEVELQRMAQLRARASQSGLVCEELTQAELRAREPRIAGLGAIFVPSTGIVSYTQITQKMVDRFGELGGVVRMAARVTAISETQDHVDVHTSVGPLRARRIIVCAGGQADRMAALAGMPMDFAIVPFRGEYFRLRAGLNGVTKSLIYPIPDPDLPFLGIHLTRMIDGSVTVGPNAVLGFAREGYGRFNVDAKDLWSLASFAGTWRLLPTYWTHALRELANSVWRKGYLEECRKYCPELTLDDLHPYPVGIRAQAVSQDGRLLHDFLIRHTQRMTHVCNAPSPAATSAIPIGRYIINEVLGRHA